MHVRRLLSRVIAFSLLVVLGFSADALPAADPPRDPDAIEIVEVALGFGGNWKPAVWTPVRVRLSCAAEVRDARVVVSAIDNRGGRVRYAAAEPHVLPAGSSTLWRYVRIGDVNQPVLITVEDSQGAVLAAQQMAIGDGALSLQRGWVLALGSALGIDQLGRGNLLDTAGTVDVSIVDHQSLPTSSYGYDGVDLIVIPAGQAVLYEHASEDQIAALERWLRRGGRVLVSAGGQIRNAVKAAPWLARLIGSGAESIDVVTAPPGTIEAYVSARHPLREFKAARFEVPGIQLFLAGRTQNLESFPLIFERLYGFGRVTVFAADFDAPPFVDWPERTQVLAEVFPQLLRDTRSAEPASAVGGREGYRDLAGQLSTSLDKPGGGVVPFSWVAGLMLLYIGLIGPLDYLIINRLLGRPWLGWLTFGIAIGVAAVGLAAWSRQVRTAQVVVRAVEFIDIAPYDSARRALGWMRVHSGPAGGYDVRLAASEARAGWLGVAGPVYGGFEPPAAIVQPPPYSVLTGAARAEVVGMPIARSGSRGLETAWTPGLGVDPQADLEQIPGSDLIRGRFRNPFNVDLFDGALIYRNRIYLLPTRLTPRQEVAELDRLSQKNFSWRLTRRQLLAGASATEPWDPARVDDPRRIVEVLQFYEAAGGEKYTHLDNRPLRHLDLSYLLGYDRAILVGRIAASDAEVQVEGPAATQDLTVERDVFVRVVYPVATNGALAGTE